MKKHITTEQAITLYNTIEALLNQFDRDNQAKVPDCPRYVCCVCKDEQIGNTAHTSSDGNRHYCYKCWKPKTVEELASMVSSEKSKAAENEVA